MKTLKKVYNVIVDIAMWIALVLLAVVIVLNAYEIFQRNVFHKSFIWLQEYSTLMMLWFAMLGTAKIVNENQDITVEMFVKRFPAKVHTAVNAIVSIAISVFLGLLIRQTYLLFSSQAGNTTLIAKYPLQLRSAAMLIGFVLILVKNILNVVDSCVSLFNRSTGQEVTEK